MNDRGFLSLVLFASLSLAGCGAETQSNEPDTFTVSGEVSLDGQPLPSGRIQFIDIDKTPPREYVINIAVGKFSGQVGAGRKRVEIRAFHEDVETSVGGAPTDVDPQYLPKRYNDESDQTVEISASAPNVQKFDLVTKE